MRNQKKSLKEVAALKKAGDERRKLIESLGLDVERMLQPEED